MTEALLVSNLILWVVVIALTLTVLALARQIGVLHERLAPMGALTMDTGPKVGTPAPSFELPTLDGATLQTGGISARSRMLFFLSPDCPVCKKLLPVLRSLSRAERGTLDIVLASDGETEEHASFYAREKLAPFPYVLSTELGMRFRISKLPYAVVIGPDGMIKAKGLVNSREQVESLLTAQELGVASIQDYLARDTISAD
jgi:methylamine dehydrogenase accessory protein MauD